MKLCRQNGNIYSDLQLNIMRTSTLTAFPRIFTDIPYSCEIFQYALKEIHQSNLFSFQSNLFCVDLAPELEARHKAMNMLLDQYTTAQDNLTIIELGAGLSPHRLEYQKHIYYEIDYPPVTDLKKRIYDSMGYSSMKNSLIGLDLTDTNALFSFLTSICKTNNQNTLFISEGLFWYLPLDSIRQLSSTIYNILQINGGLWISLDCPVEEEFQDKDHFSIIANSSGQNNNKPFYRISEFTTFFQSLHFNVETHKLTEFISSSSLMSPKILSINSNIMKERLKRYTNLAILTL